MELNEVRKLFSGRGIELKEKGNEFWCSIIPENIIEILKKLKEGGITDLILISSMDMMETIDVVYHFSFDENERYSLNIRVPLHREKPEIESITSVYPAAMILEREAFEMVGINFKGHPDLRKAFLDESSPETPLRRGK
ncbi:MAG: NADH-quinone oxidoreductase subunit C [Candidatus Aenigmarchaeota archaeon]|nr:NADH-quinone oxidoreductase subunit C [Candidatus Aenigmarchaeota archaeon]